MKKFFVPYKEALQLKELAFKEEVLKVYNINDTESGLYNLGSFSGDDELYAPIYQQAFTWFREKFELDLQVVYETFYIRHKIAGQYYRFQLYYREINKLKNKKIVLIQSRVYDTYEEAQIEGLKECIELTKEKINL